MFNQQTVTEAKVSDIEIQFARLLRQAITTGIVDAEFRQNAQAIAEYYEIDLSAADCHLASEIALNHSEEAYVIQQLRLTEQELEWGKLDALKLNNQARRYQKLCPLNPDGSQGNWTNKSLYPSSRDYIRWEVMRNRNAF